MKEYEFRGGVIEYLVNMLHDVWYIRLDRLLSSIRNVIVKATNDTYRRVLERKQDKVKKVR